MVRVNSLRNNILTKIPTPQPKTHHPTEFTPHMKDMICSIPRRPCSYIADQGQLNDLLNVKSFHRIKIIV